VTRERPTMRCGTAFIPALLLRVFSRLFGASVVLIQVLLPARAHAQGGGDTLSAPPARRFAIPVVRLARIPEGPFTAVALVAPRAQSSAELAAEWRSALLAALSLRERAQWNASVRRYRDGGVGQAVTPTFALADTLAVQPDTGIAAMISQIFGDQVGLETQGTLETKLDRTRNERCTSGQYFTISTQCSAGFQPSFDFRFNLRAGGVIQQRLHLNVDYDTEREFDASNNINIFYQGKSDELFNRIEIGNVSLDLPPSQFITSGIPQGNYGVQAIGQLGPAKFRTIWAQQRGNVPKAYSVIVGDRTLKPDSRDLEDYQIESRRFFWTVDPFLFGAAYPNIDVLNATQMRALAEALPQEQRPRKLSVYRLLIGGQPPNPNGPRFQIIGDPNSQRGQVYELLRENLDYYTDPSLLWIALARPVNLQNERLVVAYTLRIGGRDTVIASNGGTPDVSYVPERAQLAHLLYDPQVRPTDPAFRREIRAFYRVAGEELRRQSVTVRITTGGGTGQEKPLGGTAETYLQMFGISQSGNAASFDVDNRLWPRLGDPNVAVGATTANAKIIRDYFLVLPSVRPFARDGLVQPGNPATDTIYTTPYEDLYSAHHPQSNYRLLLRYEIEGAGESGSISLGAGQLRKGSEIVVMDNVQLERGPDKDYTIDYELGIITFSRPDTLFAGRARQVTVRYEENPLFAAAPTSIRALNAQIPFERGALGFTAISQSQSTAFTRPPLGYEPQSAFIAGLNGRFAWEAAGLSRLLERIPTVGTTTLSRVEVSGEVAMSRPQPNRAGQAYVESFEGEGGINVALTDAAWYYSSQPSLGSRLPQRLGAETFGLGRAATMAWQNVGLSRAGFPITFNITQIDPQVTLTGSGLDTPEQLLWLTLYPLRIGGLLGDRTQQFQWIVDDAPMGRRWRSVRTILGASGADLSRVEMMEFWTLADTSLAGISRNPTLVMDLGDISENSVSFGPIALNVNAVSPGVNDTTYTGKALMGWDELNTERDSVSKAFNVVTDDKGLPGDVVPTMAVFKDGDFDILQDFATCSGGAFRLLLLGDSRANCTVRNGRLDEEDIDFDGVLNMTESQRESERIRRYIVDLSVRSTFNRVGKCSVALYDTAAGGTVQRSDLCWVQVRVPFRAADDSLNGGPNIRRVRAMRITVVSGEGMPDTAFTTVPIGRFRLIGSPLTKRTDRTVRGIAGDQPALGFTIASVIGTQDRDTLRNLDYEPPPGVSDAADRQQTGLENLRAQINERSLRLLAGGLDVFDRAEAYIRFAEGPKNFMNYRELRVWARGRGNGWGESGELQFYIKVGRDQNNFYLYRTPVNSGPGRAAWLPEVRVDFNQLFELRAQLQNSFLGLTTDSIACTGADSALIARSGVPIGQPINRHAACANGYMVYSVDPAVNPPSLAQVQEISVGMVRVASGGGLAPIMPADTLELWVDDIRLTDVENTPGYAGQLGVTVNAGDVASVRMNVVRRDANFRQLAEQPSFITSSGIEFASTLRLERLVPGVSNYSMPLTISRSQAGSEPLFLSQSDIPGDAVLNLRTPRSNVTNFNINMRRTTPLHDALWGTLLNNLALNASVSRAASRAELSDGGTSAWNAGLDWSLLLPAAQTVRLPGWLERVLMRGAPDPRIRINPTQFVISSQMGHIADRRTSFSKPAAIATDTGRLVTSLSSVWRTSTALEFRPVTPLSVRWNFSTVRDLRDYGDTSATSIVASGERQRLVGLDVGLERERQMNTTATYAPAITAWFRPSLTFLSSYGMQRDPQTRTLVRTGDSTGAFRLPRRFNNAQTISATSIFDPARAVRAWQGEESRIGKMAGVFQQFDLDYSRTYQSAFDAAPFTPGFGYQMALGGVGAFRETDGFLAATAGATDQGTISTGFRLPFDIALTTSGQRSRSRNYTRRVDNSQALIEGDQRRFPDARLRWTIAPARIPFISNVAANIGYNRTRQLTFVPADNPETPGDRRIGLTSSYPVSTAISWDFRGQMVTGFGMNLTDRVDSLPGSITTSHTRGLNADASRIFRLPETWKTRGGVRARMTWQQEVTTTHVSLTSARDRRRLADNGRTYVSLNADTGFSQNLLFKLQAARIVTFDNNYNRRVSQFIITVGLTLQYLAGDLSR
jgi:hypothetical protein